MKTVLLYFLIMLFTIPIFSTGLRNQENQRSHKNIEIKNVTHDKTLAQKIDSMRVAFDFPAVAYGVIRNDSILALNAVGYRDNETKEKVEVTDYFHIGSCTKSFLGFLAGSIVDKGLIQWQSKFFDLFPELKSNSHTTYHEITLQQLLSHRARLQSFKNDDEVFATIREYEKDLPPNSTIAQRRYYCVAHTLKMEPQNPDLSLSVLYSNMGFTAACLMLEKVSGKTWEELINDLSNELELDLHIGWPIDYSDNQPKGHVNPQKWMLESDKELVPIPQISMDYHLVKEFYLLSSPGGNLSITTENFLKYAKLYIHGFNGEDNFLKNETYKTIFKTYPEYSMGWWIEGEGDNVHYSHRGSNGAFYSFITVQPKINLAMVVMINTHKESGLTDIIQLLEKEFIDPKK